MQCLGIRICIQHADAGVEGLPCRMPQLRYSNRCEVEEEKRNSFFIVVRWVSWKVVPVLLGCYVWQKKGSEEWGVLGNEVAFSGPCMDFYTF